MNKKRITLFLISQNISLFGSSVVGFAIIWYITLKTSSGMWLMLATICSMVPQVLISLIGGVWADKYNKKNVIMLADGFIALSTLCLAISFLMGYKNIVMLLLISIIRSIGAGIQTPAVNAIYPQLVPKDKLVTVQGINQTLSSVLLLLAPAIGGLLLGPVKIIWAFMLDVVTASIAIVIIYFIKFKEVKQKKVKKPMFGQLKEGLNYTLNDKYLKLIICFYALSFFLITPIAVLSPLFIERVFGSDVWRLTTNELFWTTGTLLGGIFISLNNKFDNKPFIINICLIAFGITFTMLGIVKKFILFIIIMGIAGIFMPIITTAVTVFIQENVKSTMLGRVFSILQIISSGAMPFAILIFGPLADLIMIETIFIIIGLLMLSLSVMYKLKFKLIK